MEAQLMQIQAKPQDYKVCRACGRINWYENKECIECGSDDFSDNVSLVEEYIQEEYRFYTQEYESFEDGKPLTEEEADFIKIEV